MKHSPLARKNRLGHPGMAGALGAGVGLLIGGRLVKTYDWRTEWLIPAPLPIVYEAMTSRSALRRWWPSMQPVGEMSQMTNQAQALIGVTPLTTAPPRRR